MIVREYYQLSELTKRWECTVSDLLHLGSQDRIQICVNIYGMASGLIRTRINFEDNNSEKEIEPQSEAEKLESAKMDAAFESWLKRTTRDMPHGIFELNSESIRFMEMPNGLPFELFEARKFDNGWWDVEFDPPVLINIEHLCMLHEEVLRLDKVDLEKLCLIATSDEMTSAIIEQFDSLQSRYSEFAESSGINSDHAKLYRIGNWQRIVMLDRTEGGEQYLSKSDSLLLSKTCHGEGSGYFLDGDISNLEWRTAGVRERLVALGLHIYARVVSGEATNKEALFLFGLASEVAGVIAYDNPFQGGEDTLVKLGRLAANSRHSRPGGSREKRRRIQEIWKTGKYSSRDVCAEQECAALGMSFSTARKALRGTPDPR